MSKETDCGKCVKEDVCHIRLTKGGMIHCRNYYEDPQFNLEVKNGN